MVKKQKKVILSEVRLIPQVDDTNVDPRTSLIIIILTNNIMVAP